MINRFIGMGRLTRDPEVRYSQNCETAIGRVTVAIDRAKKADGSDNGADFIPCICFGKVAEFAEKYLTKGMKVGLEGRLQTGSYQREDGTRVYTIDCIVEKWEFADGKKNNNQEPAQPSADGDFMNVPDSIDEQLPFK